MARARNFDLDAATDAAVELFWRQGFAATTTRQLCEATGLQPGSFYAAFGSKQACFRAALDRYLATQRLPTTPGPGAVRAWLRAITLPARRHRGCLLVNTAVEGPNLDAATRRFVAQRLAAMQTFFVRCLGDGPDAVGGATQLSSAVVSIHVLARAGVAGAQLRAVADGALGRVGLARLDDS
jgi:TetR/AcrR family transcriptional repressor of nem operon